LQFLRGQQSGVKPRQRKSGQRCGLARRKPTSRIVRPTLPDAANYPALLEALFMTADSDDLERALQENLRLREDLEAKAAGGEAALRHSQFADPNWQAFFFAILLLLISIMLVLIITTT
jgi:hypothetical protein